MFATDFPHIECEWPNSQSFIENLYHDVPEDEKRKILSDNMIKYFHLEDAFEVN
jgi:predicted TIM-barrel fold metal-dependent hydrolase